MLPCKIDKPSLLRGKYPSIFRVPVRQVSTSKFTRMVDVTGIYKFVHVRPVFPMTSSPQTNQRSLLLRHSRLKPINAR